MVRELRRARARSLRYLRRAVARGVAVFLSGCSRRWLPAFPSFWAVPNLRADPDSPPLPAS